MRQSRMFIPTTKQVNDEDSTNKSLQFMQKAGMIKQLASGIYSYLPLAYKVLNQIENIVREELEKIDCVEMLMPTLQPKELWEESGRWQKYGAELMRLQDRHQRDFCLGPTHEEVIVSIIRDHVKSWRALPLALFQIQTKFRDELRPRFGLMRAREFIMADAYSFHTQEDDFKAYYEKVSQAYEQIFKRIGLKVIKVKADSGNIGGDLSTEFMAISDVGEDTLVLCDECGYSANLEKAQIDAGQEIQEGENCVVCNHKLSFKKGIEVGHIFKLGDVYTKPLKATYLNQDQKAVPIQMGCYGIGISRILMAVVENLADDDGIVWPEALQPYDYHLLIVDVKKNEQVKLAEELYKKLTAQGYRVLLDDTDNRVGAKFANSDLIGIAQRIVVGQQAADKEVEYFDRRSDKKETYTMKDLLAHIGSAN